MPSRNILKIDIADSYYHVYARGNNRQPIFLDTEDYNFFTKLFVRYLSKQPQPDGTGTPYATYYDKIELLCFCLMDNHFHLLLYQRDQGSMTALMRGIMTSYSRYFNNKYDRTGSLFESRYKASHIDNQAYLEHISRYIHLNRKDWRSTVKSSIRYYITNEKQEWVRPQKILDIFDSRQEYETFVGDYEAHKEMLHEIKYELANDTTPYI